MSTKRPTTTSGRAHHRLYHQSVGDFETDTGCTELRSILAIEAEMYAAPPAAEALRLLAEMVAVFGAYGDGASALGPRNALTRARAFLAAQPEEGTE